MKTLKVLFAVLTISFITTAAAFAAPETQVLKQKGDQYLREGKVQQAITEYKKVLREVPDSTSTYFNLAVAYYQQGDLYKSAKALKKLLERDAADTEARYNLACIELYLGNMDEARLQFQQGLVKGQDPRFQDSMKRGLDLIEKLGKEPQSTQDIIFLATKYGLPPLAK